MHIIACVKQVPDIEALRARNKQEAIKIAPLVVNPYDLLAVEEAVRLREKGEAGSVSLLSFGPASAEKVLRDCLAIGGDRAVLLCDTTFDKLDSYVAGKVLAVFIARQIERYDLIFCGARAVDTDAGQVGALLAEELGIPLISSVIRIEVSPDKRRIIVERKLEKGNREAVETLLPVVLSVQTGLNNPRYPTLRSIMAARKKEIEHYDVERLGLSLNELRRASCRIHISGFAMAKPKLRKVFTPDTNLSPVQRLLSAGSGGMISKESTTIEGNPRDIASRLVWFLEENKLWKKPKKT